MKRTLFIIAVFSLLASTMGYTQTSASATFTTTVTIVEPIGITTNSNMNFARIEAGEGGRVILSPDNTRTTQGAVYLTQGEPSTAASFKVFGNDGFTYDLSLPQGDFILRNGEQEMVIRNFQSDIEGSGSLTDGQQTVRVGATLEINPDQTPGRYSSDGGFQVTVNYN